MTDEQEALVAVGRRRVVGDEEAVEVELGCRPCEVGQLELAVGRRESVGLQRVGAVGVALDQLGERVALELGAQVQARGAGQVVEPVAVLQLLELRLEHVVERAAQEAAEEVGDLGEAADPQVDLVQAGVGDAVGVVAQAGPWLNMKSAASAGIAGSAGLAGSTMSFAAARLPAMVLSPVMDG